MFFNCKICKDETPVAFREAHHVFPQSAGGKDLSPDGSSNLIVICATCHGTIHTVAQILRSKKAGTVDDILAYIDEGKTKLSLINYAKEVNRAYILKKDGLINLKDKEEPVSFTLPEPLKKRLKTLAQETYNPKTKRSYGVSSYVRALVLSHLKTKT